MTLALLVLGASLATGVHSASADVSAVKGSAFGFTARNITIFNGPQPETPAAPAVTLAVDASNSPQSASAPSGLVKYGPATLFSSGPITVNTSGKIGAGGTVTSSTDIQNVNTSGQEVFTASRLQSTCSASESGVSGSTTVTGGTLRTSEGDPNVDGDDTNVDVPPNPQPNTAIKGKLEGVGDSFTYVFNEQVTNPDGSITVNAAHLIMEGPTAKGDVIIGQSVCGVTASAGGTTTTAAPGSSTTTTAAATSTTAPGAAASTTTTAATTATTGVTTTTTTAPSSGAGAPATGSGTTSTQTTTAGAGGDPAATSGVTDVGGGAYGFYITISLFGGPPATRGPTPVVTLPAGGSASPVTASEPSGAATFGPATLFTSDQLVVSTQGTTGPDGSVTSSADITNQNKSGQEQFTAAAIGSKCSASSSGVSGSTSISGGRLITSEGDPDVDGDETIVDMPSSPAPNTAFDAKLENVGDTFRVILNEQLTTSGGMTVNAMHMQLLGPTAVGELIVGQSRCSLSASGGSGGGGGSGSRGGLASTGNEAGLVAVLALALVGAGWNTTCFARWRRTLRAERSGVHAASGAPHRAGGGGGLGGWGHRMRRWTSNSPS